jgi:hypothetical protein
MNESSRTWKREDADPETGDHGVLAGEHGHGKGLLV